MSLDRAFCQLTPTEQKALLSRAGRVLYRNGDVIIEEGQVLNLICVIASGQVRITHDVNGTISAEFAAPLGPGDFIGEVTFIDGRGASGTITADGDVEIITIERAVLDGMIAADSTFSGRLYHSLLMTSCRRLRTTNIRALISG